jgi:hypothetical protein
MRQQRNNRFNPYKRRGTPAFRNNRVIKTPVRTSLPNFSPRTWNKVILSVPVTLTNNVGIVTLGEVYNTMLNQLGIVPNTDNKFQVKFQWARVAIQPTGSSNSLYQRFSMRLRQLTTDQPGNDIEAVGTVGGVASAWSKWDNVDNKRILIPIANSNTILLETATTGTIVEGSYDTRLCVIYRLSSETAVTSRPNIIVPTDDVMSL